jgi:hypothetical protein
VANTPVAPWRVHWIAAAGADEHSATFSVVIRASATRTSIMVKPPSAGCTRAARFLT